mmetsp:Transcript_7777/g.19365  ORF Transcript_7777/g.19365 Transcript_7777/m.19365 type:complete len:227 (-) Transcript_7777:3915-4595(-)
MESSGTIAATRQAIATSMAVTTIVINKHHMHQHQQLLRLRLVRWEKASPPPTVAAEHTKRYIKVNNDHHFHILQDLRQHHRLVGMLVLVLLSHHKDMQLRRRTTTMVYGDGHLLLLNAFILSTRRETTTTRATVVLVPRHVVVNQTHALISDPSHHIVVCLRLVVDRPGTKICHQWKKTMLSLVTATGIATVLTLLVGHSRHRPLALVALFPRRHHQCQSTILHQT